MTELIQIDINIKYGDKNYLVKTNEYGIIKEIFYDIYQKKYDNFDCLVDFDKFIENYYFTFNGRILENNEFIKNCGIEKNNLLIVNQKIKGGNNVGKFIKDNPFLFIFTLLIIIGPIFTLSSGFLSGLSTFSKAILNKSFNTIFSFLICNYGKVTLVHRAKFFIGIITFVMFVVIIYVTFTLPLTLLCLLMKGYSLFDNPSSICGPIKAGNIGGLVLVILYFLSYMYYMLGNAVLNPLINLCNKSYFSSTSIAPILTSMRNSYNNNKYIFSSASTTLACLKIDSNLKAFDIFISSAVEMGCSSNTFNANKFMNKVKAKSNANNEIPMAVAEPINNSFFGKIQQNQNKKKEEEEKMMYVISTPINQQRQEQKNKERKKNQTTSQLVANTSFSNTLANIAQMRKNEQKEKTNTNKDDEYKCKAFGESSCCNEKNFYNIANLLLVMLGNKSACKKIYAYNLYSAFLLVAMALYERSSENNILTEDEKTKVVEGMKKLDELMKIYASEKGFDYNGLKYSLLNKIFKIIFMTSFCNVISTANTSEDILRELNGIEEVGDILKSGLCSGKFVRWFYVLAIIILIICGFLNIF